MPKTSEEQVVQYYAPDRQKWREWLEKNHATAKNIWLVYYKKNSGKPSVSYDEAVEEALCFGWIDSRTNSIDEARYIQLFTPRKPKSVWSKLNKQRIEKLMAQGLIAPAGFAAIEIAQKNGAWNSLDAVEAMEVPADLSAALAANETASRNFEAFSPSVKKPLLQWLQSARREETRFKRIEQIVQSAEENRNLLQYIPKDKRATN